MARQPDTCIRHAHVIVAAGRPASSKFLRRFDDPRDAGPVHNDVTRLFGAAAWGHKCPGGRRNGVSYPIRIRTFSTRPDRLSVLRGVIVLQAFAEFFQLLLGCLIGVDRLATPFALGRGAAAPWLARR